MMFVVTLIDLVIFLLFQMSVSEMGNGIDRSFNDVHLRI